MDDKELAKQYQEAEHDPERKEVIEDLRKLDDSEKFVVHEDF